MLPAYLLSQLTPAAVKLYISLFTRMDPKYSDPIVRASIPDLARHSFLSTRTCKRALAELLRLHMLRRLRRYYQEPTSYEVLPIPAKPPQSSGAKMASSPTTTGANLAPSLSTTGADLAPPPLTAPPTAPAPAPKKSTGPNPPPLNTHTPTTSANLAPQTPPPIPDSLCPPPDSALSILLNLFADNTQALAPEIQQLAATHMNALVRHLHAQLTPEERAIALAAAQARNARDTSD